MEIKNEQSHRRRNHNQLSHKCPTAGALNAKFQIQFLRDGKNRPIKSAKKYQCSKFRRVCMIMGVLVLIEESESGGVDFQDLMPKDYIHRSGRQNKSLIASKFKFPGFPSNKKFNVATQVFKPEARDDLPVSDESSVNI